MYSLYHNRSDGVKNFTVLLCFNARSNPKFKYVCSVRNTHQGVGERGFLHLNQCSGFGSSYQVQHYMLWDSSTSPTQKMLYWCFIISYSIISQKYIHLKVIAMLSYYFSMKVYNLHIHQIRYGSSSEGRGSSKFVTVDWCTIALPFLKTLATAVILPNTPSRSFAVISWLDCCKVS